MSDLIKKIKSSIEVIPGIIDYDNLDFNSDSKSNDGWIMIDEEENIVNIKIAIIISRNVSTKNLSKEIQQLIKYVLKKEKIALGNLDIYIKGVK